MKELVAWYKANPAKANFGSPAPGSLPHFFGLMIGKGAGVELIHVPYNGGAPMMNGLMGDQVAAGIDTTVEMIELHRAGKIRILGTSGATRSPLLPEVPTLVESGLAGVEGTGWFAVYAPAKTPRRRCASSTPRSTRRSPPPRCASASSSSGLEPTGGSAADLAKRMTEDTARWGPIVKASGFKAD
jgi:tripartite-type tricarboxylate transporter receptor subunit TctC